MGGVQRDRVRQLGARRAHDRYGDFFDVCAAITGRVPYADLHIEENRRATVCFDASGLPEALLASELAYPLLGFVIGHHAGNEIPVLDGVPAGQSEDRIKAHRATLAEATHASVEARGARATIALA